MIAALPAAFLGLAALGAPGASAPPGIPQLLQHLGFDPKLEPQMLDGKVLSTGMPEMEEEKNELAVSAVMLVVRRPLDVVVDAYMDGTVFKIASGVHAFEVIDLDRAGQAPKSEFARIGYEHSEIGEARKLVKFKGGEQFNLSAEEIEQLGQLKPKGDQVVPMASDALRGIVIERFHDYQQHGIEGVMPYKRSGNKQSSPRKELTVATASMTLLRDHFADVYDSLLTFPVSPPDGSDIEHRFFWIKQDFDKRPNFVLSHHVADIHADSAIVVEQQYWVANSYNSQESVLGCVPYEGGTVVFYTNRTFTDQITGFAAGLARSIGRGKVEQAVSEHFSALRDELENR